MTAYYFSDGNVTLSGTGALDELVFEDDIGGTFDHRNFSFLRSGDDLFIYADNGATITIEDHFASTTDRYETLTFDGASIDLSSAITILTTNSNSTPIYGTETDNLILGAKGNNITIYGYSGDDVIYGGDGEDQITGGNGNDIIYGGSGIDTIYGGEFATGSDDGDDIIYGGIGTDVISGGRGADLLHGGNDNDFLTGDEGSDIQYGDEGNDIVTDKSSLSIISGNDQMFGGNGNDLIVTYDGQDVLYGGSGNDVLLTIDLGTNSTLCGESGNDLLSTMQHDSMNTGTSNLSTFNPWANNFGGVIDTTFNSCYFNTNFCGGSGDDLYEIGMNNVLTSDVNHVIFDSSGSDDRLYLNTQINSGLTINFYFSHLNLIAEITENNPSDNQSFIITLENFFSENGENEIEHIFRNFSNGRFFPSPGTSSEINLSNFISIITGTANNDTPLNGTTDPDIIDALAGNDTIYAGVGGDIVYGRAGMDMLYGEGGDDYLFGGDDDDTLFGGAGDDAIDGGSGADTVSYASSTSGVSVDLRTGLATDGLGGTDTLTAVENIIGSAYNDSFAGSAGVNSFTGGDGTDTVDYSSAASGITLTLHGGTASNDGDGGSDTLSGIENVTGSAYADTITGSDGANVIVTGNGGDTVQARAGNDTVTGGTGNDTLYGGAGNDAISGGDGADNLRGEGDDDTIHGGAGGDTLYGGTGGDTLYGGDDADYIAGEAGNDTLYGDNGADSMYGGDNNDTLYGGAGNDTIIRGDAGTDTLYGGGGADLLRGGADADIFAWLASDVDGSLDTIDDFSAAGGDKIDLSDILSLYDPMTDLLADYVQITEGASSTTFWVDASGSGTFSGTSDFVILTGVTSILAGGNGSVSVETDLQSLVSNGTLLV